MTKHLTMNTVIHAAFRRDMKRFHEALAAFTPGDTARAAELGRAWGNFAHQLHQHHDDEETIFWPAFTQLGVDPALVEELDGEHDRMGAALVGAEGAMTVFTADARVEIAKAPKADVARRLLDILRETGRQ